MEQDRNDWIMFESSVVLISKYEVQSVTMRSGIPLRLAYRVRLLRSASARALRRARNTLGNFIILFVRSAPLSGLNDHLLFSICEKASTDKQDERLSLFSGFSGKRNDSRCVLTRNARPMFGVYFRESHRDRRPPISDIFVVIANATLMRQCA